MQTENQTQIRLNDVFRFRYHPEEAKKRFDPSHCFDGKLVVKQSNNDFFDNGLYLEDTYWHSGSDSYRWSLKETLKRETIELICNLDEVAEIKEYEQGYYADSDIFNLSRQHGCYKQFAVRKGAARSKEKMLKTLQKQIEKAEHDAEFANRQIEKAKENITKIETGDLNIYL